MSTSALSVMLILAAVVVPSMGSEGKSRRRAPPPPQPAPTPAPPLPPKPSCQLSAKCQQGLSVHRPCMQTGRDGGRTCYKGLKIWAEDLMQTYGCPNFASKNQSVLDSQAFCWCGLGGTSSLSTPAAVHQNHSSTVSVDVQGGSCHNRHDGGKLKKIGKTGVSNAMKACGDAVSDMKNPPPQGSPAEQQDLGACMQNQVDNLGAKCANCFALSIQCSEQYCLSQCACVGYTDTVCSDCMKQYCRSEFDHCSGLKTPSAAAAAVAGGYDTDHDDLFELSDTADETAGDKSDLLLV